MLDRTEVLKLEQFELALAQVAPLPMRAASLPEKWRVDTRFLSCAAPSAWDALKSKARVYQWATLC